VELELLGKEIMAEAQVHLPAAAVVVVKVLLEITKMVTPEVTAARVLLLIFLVHHSLTPAAEAAVVATQLQEMFPVMED
jgi:hypothetical protein